ncbi:MAG: septum formation protein Maf [Flavobacteriales bacterium]|jgi:septum formation protein|nr:septum formation protein Maf [Flavobacteriales bacterium]
MLTEKLKKYNIILGSASPRRKELLKGIGLNFSIKITDKEESYPTDLKDVQIVEFLAKQKQEFLSKELKSNDLLITADTIVSQKGEVLHKPKDKNDAKNILFNLSGNSHRVITGICIKTLEKEVTFSTITTVHFNKLSETEIEYYINKFKPFDKAGSYGIQEWIGYIAIAKIEGSYNNVVGLPTADLYQKLKLFI